MRARHLLLRAWASEPGELPWRIRQLVRDQRPHQAPPCPGGAAPRWPGPRPPVTPAVARAAAPWRTPTLPPPPHPDPKPAWFHHRLRHLALLQLAGQERHARAQADLWLSAHPHGRGLPWATGVEVACRLTAWVLLQRRDQVHSHAHWLLRHPSRYSSENNHRVAELGALALAAAALPDHPQASTWRRAAAELPRVFQRQVHADGVGREQSPAYLAFSLEWALLAALAGLPRLTPAIQAASAFLGTLLDAAGHLPQLGDDGGERVLPDTDQTYVLSVTGAARVTLGLPPPPAWRPDLRSALLTDRPARAPAAPTSRCYPHGGLTILRTPEAHLVFDHGPLGMAPLAAHGHADALAIWLHLHHRPVLVGRGSSSYHLPLVRQAERTVGSSTLTVGGAASSVPSRHPFLWRRQTSAHLDHLQLGPQGGAVAAHHTGYPGLRHRRALSLTPGELLVEDEVLGPPQCRAITVRWHLHPDLDVEILGLVACISHDRHPLVCLHSPLPLRVEHTPHAQGYGHTTAALTLVAEGPQRLPQRWLHRFTW